MYEVFNVGKTLLLDGQPMSLVTPAGVEGWIDQAITYSSRYDQVRDPLDGQMKYRCIYEKDGVDVPFVLVNDPDDGDGRVILFSGMPDQPPVIRQRR
ncbi:hypothetical protein [Marivita sp.]|mgnify:CR=1 FL=1|uniref:hypothetical protein n=1 Tax=Marivita sp. TaxID=2003365 RepID=UPI0025BA70EB|nr:hypothetical protein [Marivita sp.]